MRAVFGKSAWICWMLALPASFGALNDRAAEWRDEALPAPDLEALGREKAARAVVLERSLCEQQVAALLDAFDCASRRRDPFGLPTQGDVLPLENTDGLADREASRSAAFGQALRKLKFSAVSPRRKEVFLGARKLKVGQCLILKFRGEELEAKLVELSGDLAVFEDGEGLVRLALPLGILPSRVPLGGGR